MEWKSLSVVNIPFNTLRYVHIVLYYFLHYITLQQEKEERRVRVLHHHFEIIWSKWVESDLLIIWSKYKRLHNNKIRIASHRIPSS